MNRPKMIMMCGLVGSGKSYKAKEIAEKYNANIHSSDAIREELTGDINNQDVNDLVFKTLHNRVKEDLKNDKNCIYDATNISYKRRMAFLQELNKIPCEKICVLMATPYETCLERNSQRDRKVPEHVIKSMYLAFDPPFYYEGWGDICIEYSEGSRDSFGYPAHWLDKVMDFNQDNDHHTLTLGQHCDKVWEYLSKNYHRPTEDAYLRVAGILHDNGKCFAKVFKNSKGEITEQAHYYGHEHCGSYDSLFYKMFFCAQLYVAVLIRWHMQPYFWEKDNNEKQRNKYRKLWGEKLYDDIIKLHEADIQAH